MLSGVGRAGETLAILKYLLCLVFQVLWWLRSYGCQRRGIRRLGWRVGELMKRRIRSLGRVDDRAIDAIEVERADGVFEYDPLVVTLAMPLRLDAIATNRPTLIALDTAFSARFRPCQKLDDGTEFTPRSRKVCSRGGHQGHLLRQPVFVLFLTFAFLRFGSSLPFSSLFSEGFVGDLSPSGATSAESILEDASVLRVRSGKIDAALDPSVSLDAVRLHRLVPVTLGGSEGWAGLAYASSTPEIDSVLPSRSRAGGDGGGWQMDRTELELCVCASGSRQTLGWGVKKRRLLRQGTSVELVRDKVGLFSRPCARQKKVREGGKQSGSKARTRRRRRPTTQELDAFY